MVITQKMLDSYQALANFPNGRSLNTYEMELDMIIPWDIEEVELAPDVRWIPAEAFEGRGHLHKVVFNAGLREIGNRAFTWCTNLESVVIPNGVTSIGDKAFYECISLASVRIPPSVMSIGDEAFTRCSGLTGFLSIPSGVTSIGVQAFEGCTQLTSIAIPPSVTDFGFRAFADCTSMASATIDEGVMDIGDEAFRNCSALASVVIPDSVTSIGLHAFDGCTSLASAIIGKGIQSIGRWAFCHCTSFESVAIPEGVTHIGSGAFEGCSSLTSVAIPSSVESFGSEVFKDCTQLESVAFGNNANYCGYDITQNCTSLKSARIPLSGFAKCASHWDNHPDGTPEWPPTEVASLCSAPYSVPIGMATSLCDALARNQEPDKRLYDHCANIATNAALIRYYIGPWKVPRNVYDAAMNVLETVGGHGYSDKGGCKAAERAQQTCELVARFGMSCHHATQVGLAVDHLVQTLRAQESLDPTIEEVACCLASLRASHLCVKRDKYLQDLDASDRAKLAAYGYLAGEKNQKRLAPDVNAQLEKAVSQASLLAKAAGKDVGGDLRTVTMAILAGSTSAVDNKGLYPPVIDQDIIVAVDRNGARMQHHGIPCDGVVLERQMLGTICPSLANDRPREVDSPFGNEAAKEVGNPIEVEIAKDVGRPIVSKVEEDGFIEDWQWSLLPLPNDIRDMASRIDGRDVIGYALGVAENLRQKLKMASRTVAVQAEVAKEQGAQDQHKAPEPKAQQAWKRDEWGMDR